MNESIVDFRFYTYLPVNKVDGSYSDDEGFYLGNILWRSILVQLKKKFEENNLLSVVKFPLIYQFMSVSEMRETVIHFLPEYAKCIGRPCYFFIRSCCKIKRCTKFIFISIAKTRGNRG